MAKLTAAEIRRQELELLLKLPTHIVVEVDFVYPKMRKVYNYAGVLNIGEHGYIGNDYVIVKGLYPGHEYSVGRISKVITNKIDDNREWIISKIDVTAHDLLVAQVNRIKRLHSILDKLWKNKQGAVKLDILFADLIAKEQEEARALNEAK